MKKYTFSDEEKQEINEAYSALFANDSFEEFRNDALSRQQEIMDNIDPDLWEIKFDKAEAQKLPPQIQEREEI